MDVTYVVDRVWDKGLLPKEHNDILTCHLGEYSRIRKIKSRFLDSIPSLHH